MPFTISDGSFTMQEIKIAGVALRPPTDVIEVLDMVRDKRVDVSGLPNATVSTKSMTRSTISKPARI